MKVVVCSTHVFWPSHCERDLEFIQQHIDAGDEVIQLVCKTEFDRCDYHMGLGPNASAAEVRARCDRCIDRLRRSQRLIEGKWRIVRYLDLPGWRKFSAPPVGPFETIDDLQQFSWDGFDAGIGVASSLISHSRLTRPDMSGYRDIVARALDSALRLHAGFRAFARQERPDLVYVFNGRFTHTRALFKACEREGIRCLVHESGSQPSHYATFENAPLHDRDNFARLVREAWHERGKLPEGRRLAEKWYEDRAGGADQAWFSYVRDHDASLLPPGWDPARPKLVAFTSSEDEFAALGPAWRNKLFPRQSDGLRMLITLMREVRPEADLVIRVHPNLANVNDPEVEKVLALAGEGVIVVPPDSKVSTYRLLREAEAVFSFGSTMGIEAVYWGKPSIQLGPSMYAQLGGTYVPHSMEELRALLSRKLQPQDREGALMFAYYLATFGQPYRYYEATGILRGRFRGVDLDAEGYRTRSTRIRHAIRNILVAAIGASATATLYGWYGKLFGAGRAATANPGDAR